MKSETHPPHAVANRYPYCVKENHSYHSLQERSDGRRCGALYCPYSHWCRHPFLSGEWGYLSRRGDEAVVRTSNHPALPEKRGHTLAFRGSTSRRPGNAFAKALKWRKRKTIPWEHTKKTTRSSPLWLPRLFSFHLARLPPYVSLFPSRRTAIRRKKTEAPHPPPLRLPPPFRRSGGSFSEVCQKVELQRTKGGSGKRKKRQRKEEDCSPISKHHSLRYSHFAHWTAKPAWRSGEKNNEKTTGKDCPVSSPRLPLARKRSVRANEEKVGAPHIHQRHPSTTLSSAPVGHLVPLPLIWS